MKQDGTERFIERTAQGVAYLFPTAWILTYAAIRTFDSIGSMVSVYLVVGIPLLIVSFAVFVIGLKHWKEIPRWANATYLVSPAVAAFLVVFGLPYALYA